MIVVLVIVIAVRQRAHRQPQPTVQHGISPVNNPAFNEPEAEYSTMIYDEIKIGPVMPPRAPQYDTVEFAMASTPKLVLMQSTTRLTPKPKSLRQ